MSTPIIPQHRTTTTSVRQAVAKLPAPSRQLDADTASRIALAYGLVLFKLLPPRQLITRLAQIGVTGDQAVEFVSICAEADRALGGAS